MTDQVSHSHKTTGKIIALHSLIFLFFGKQVGRHKILEKFTSPKYTFVVAKRLELNVYLPHVTCLSVIKNLNVWNNGNKILSRKVEQTHYLPQCDGRNAGKFSTKRIHLTEKNI